MEEDDCRDILRKRLGRLVRNGNERKILLNREASSAARALCIRDAGGAALSATQREDLYSGSRKEHTDGPVTAVLTVIRKPGKTLYRDALGREVFEFQNWGETERFARRRFNPDKIPPAVFRVDPRLLRTA